jgi:hypothetical protein
VAQQLRSPLRRRESDHRADDRPYYGPFNMSPEQRAAVMAGASPNPLEPSIGRWQLVDAKFETIGSAPPMPPSRSDRADEPQRARTSQAIIPPKVTSSLKSGGCTSR